MPRTRLIRSETHPYHITAQCNNSEIFPLPLQDVWEVMVKEMMIVKVQCDVNIHAFILMGNHFHLLCTTPKGNVDEVMQKFMKNTSQQINKKSKRSSHLWAGRYKWCLLKNLPHYDQVYRFILQNPVRAGMCPRVENYPFFVPAIKSDEELSWLNQILENDDVDIIRTGLKKSEFDVSQRNRRKFESLISKSRRV
jgi:putative transposase